MGSDTKIAVDQPRLTAPNPKPPRDKVMRIATMTEQLLAEVHAQPLDTAGLGRLRTIDTHVIDELLTDLTPDLRQELQRLALPLIRHTELSDAELRLAHAQLVGWLQGLLRAAQISLSSDIAASPNYLDRPHFEPCSPTECLPTEVASNEDNSAIRSARQTLIRAITERITQQRLTAAQAAAILDLTGPRVTQLLQANVDEFTLEELVDLLPALELAIRVVPVPEQYVGHPGRRECRND